MRNALDQQQTPKRKVLTMRITIMGKKEHTKEAEQLGLDESKLLNVYRIIGRTIVAKQSGFRLNEIINNERAKREIRSFLKNFLLFADIPEKERLELKKTLEDLK